MSIDTALREAMAMRAIKHIAEHFGNGQTNDNDEKRRDVLFLKNQHDLFHIKHDFKEGDLLQIKRGLKTVYNFLDDQPFIVVEVLKEPLVHSEEDADLPDYQLKLDLKLGNIGNAGIYKESYFNSRYFEPYQETNQTQQ